MTWDDDLKEGYGQAEHRSDWWYIGLAAVVCLAVIVLMLWDLTEGLWA